MPVFAMHRLVAGQELRALGSGWVKTELRWRASMINDPKDARDEQDEQDENELEEAQEDAAHEREEEGGYQ